MKLYEIDAALEAILENGFHVDEETGEFFDSADLERLELAREEKIEGVLCWIKGLAAEAVDIKEEEEALKKRRVVIENRAERLRDYIKDALHGEKFKSARAAVSYRTTKSVKLADDFTDIAAAAGWTDFIKTTVTPVKTEIKKALERGESITGAEIVENTSMIIK